jgi:HD-GYP domain-containing protein (c-di-GMP phosphodiesterase class II)
MADNAPERVNQHYLDHVIATAQSHKIAAGEDIVASNGIKLVAKGAQIDAATRERLLEHKLRRPLEDCLQVVGGVRAESLEPIAQALLDKHALLRVLCESERARPVPASVASVALSTPLQSLLTIHAGSQPERLEHAVGVAMLALALARRLRPGDIESQRVLLLAGLMHDVGELYIDPAYLRKGTRLNAHEWRHIVTHPLVGHRVLRDMAGAGAAVAGAVLLHHERLDGFGYPRNVAGDLFALDGQILGAAEWLMALLESGLSPLTRAGMASRLIPGEFSAELLDVLAKAARSAPDAAIELDSAPPLEDAVPRVLRIADTLRRFGQLRGWIDQRIAAAGPALRAVLDAGLRRMLRMQASFSSTGLDAQSPELLLAELAALRDPVIHVEILTLVGEMEWRMRELEREQNMRVGLLPPQDHAVVSELIARLKGRDPANQPQASAPPCHQAHGGQA